MEFGFFTQDPCLDLETNIQDVSKNLCDLVENTNGDVNFGSFPFHNELNNTLDPYSTPNKSFFKNKSHVEDSGFFGSPIDSYNFSSKNERHSNTSGMFHTTSQQPDVVPKIDRIQPPVPNLIPTWHPSYGNILLQVIPQVQTGLAGVTMMQPQVMLPYVQGFPIVSNKKQHLPRQAVAYQQNRYSRPGRNFHKKYPRRSQKGFNVLPNNHKEEEFTNLDDVVINLRELNIGSKSLYESNQAKLINKFIDALSCLSSLSNECIDIEHSILKGNTTDPPKTQNFTNDVTGYQFSYYMRCIINHSKLEQINARVMIKSLEQNFNTHVTFEKLNAAELGNTLLEDLYLKTEQLNNLSSLKIICDIVLDVNEQPGELKYIDDALNAFIKAVRSVSLCLWSLKVLIKSNQTLYLK